MVLCALRDMDKWFLERLDHAVLVLVNANHVIVRMLQDVMNVTMAHCCMAVNA